MSHDLGLVVSEILSRYFGEVVQKVGDDLFAYGCKPVGLIAKTTGLPRTLVVESLRTLLKFDLASFEPSKNENLADYKLLPDNVLLMIRYPRYLLQIKSKYGTEAELIVEELLQTGCKTATRLLVDLFQKYKDDKEKQLTLLTLKDTFISLATASYVAQAPVAERAGGGETVKDAVPRLEAVVSVVPELDVRTLVLAAGDAAAVVDNVYWRVNFERFHQEFRDDLMVQAVTRRIDDAAGELMRYYLAQMHLNSPPLAATSSPLPRAPPPAWRPHGRDPGRGPDSLAAQYVKILEDESLGFVRCGAHDSHLTVSARAAADTLARAAVARVVGARLGRAERIYRLIESKSYIEEDDIQKYAMLPNKECKELTYRLLQEHFITVQPMRKAASGGAMAKTVFLYHVDFPEVVSTVLGMARRALHRAVRRGAAEAAAHARLLDKRRRVRSIVHGMRLRAEPEANIADVEDTITPPERALLAAVGTRAHRLAAAELELDSTLFVLNWYNMYKDVKE